MMKRQRTDHGVERRIRKRQTRSIADNGLRAARASSVPSGLISSETTRQDRVCRQGVADVAAAGGNVEDRQVRS